MLSFNGNIEYRSEAAELRVSKGCKHKEIDTLIHILELYKSKNPE